MYASLISDFPKGFNYFCARIQIKDTNHTRHDKKKKFCTPVLCRFNAAGTNWLFPARHWKKRKA